MIRFHPSSVGLLMSDAQSIDPSLLPAELVAVSAKRTKTDADKALLAPYREASLSAGAKTYLQSLAKQFVYGYNKNIERRESEFLTGECDIYVPGVKTIDTKVSWDIDTFPATSAEAHDTLYEWQGRAYMHLWDVPAHEVVFVMLDTPEEMLRYEQPDLHRVGHIDPAMRITSITYERDAALESKLLRKCAVAREYLMNHVALINIEHREAA
jgi:hypothetical protein